MTISLLKRIAAPSFVALLAVVGVLPLSAQTAPPSTRVRLRFDDGWRFRRDPADKAALSAGGGLHWTWRFATSGAIDRLESATLPADLDSGDWVGAEVGVDVFDQKPGYAWYRADLGNDPKNAARTLHFEAVDDSCAVFLNGVRLTVHHGWNEPFEVPVQSAWKAGGPNTLILLVQNTGGGGGLTAPASFRTREQVEASAPEAIPGYDDRTWRTVQVPHDYVVEEPFNQRADTGHGSLPVYPAWYRKTFTLPETLRGKSVWIDFDGVYRKSTVYLNGHRLGEQSSGYIGFRYDLSRYARFGNGAKNVLAVRVDPRQAEGWWYEGGGIYRHVWLNAAEKLHLAPWGAVVRTAFVGPEAAPTSASAAMQVALNNNGASSGPVVLVSTIQDPNGRTVAQSCQRVTVGVNASRTVALTLRIPKPALWSIESPNRYSLVTAIERNGSVIDRQTTPFGIRTIRFDANKGFFLNGKSVKIKGTCNHQDFAGVGIALPDSLQTWRIRRLKEMGSNAYRCSHNPPTPELLDACDRLGMLVMDENRHLGDTPLAKTPSGTKADDLSELKSLLARDRNHPSVIMWSLCNEEFALQGTEEGRKLFAAMKKVAHDFDPTRPVTAAQNGGLGEGISLATDLQGINYNIWSYDDLHRKFPTLPMYGSETASTVSTRGIYANDKTAGYVSAYDVNAPSWATTAEKAWRPIAEREWMAGAYVWTGFDYKGEPTPYGWPCVNSHFGILDMCGFPKDNYYYYQAWWGDKPVVHLLPHWNWSGKEGQPIDVWCQGNADTVELFLNNKSLGSQAMPRYGHLQWSVPYAPGTLLAKGFRSGKLIASDRIETTGPPAALRLSTDRTTVLADNEDITVVAVEVVDAAGRVVPTADNPVTFALSAAKGTALHIAGVGNGDPSSHEPDRASARQAFNGRCMVLVQGGSQAGSVVLRASAPGLKAATMRFTAK